MINLNKRFGVHLGQFQIFAQLTRAVRRTWNGLPGTPPETKLLTEIFSLRVGGEVVSALCGMLCRFCPSLVPLVTAKWERDPGS